MSQKRKIVVVVGARPNFMKAAPLLSVLRRRDQAEVRLVHTGQHYDEKLSRLFFDELGMPKPDIDLGVGSGTHAVQTADVLRGFEPIVQRERPDCIVVVGDVNSTMAAALVAAKECVALAHVEAGLRSFDRTMPEEVNRIVTDALSDLLFVTEEGAIANLMKEGVPRERIHFVGNVMIDTLLTHRERARRSPILSQLGVNDRGYAVLTLHRPSNVDHAETFRELITAIVEIAARLPVIFPCHPRTRERLGRFGLAEQVKSWTPGVAASGLTLTEPLGYLDFLRLTDGARMILTDSGGIQEESTALGVPCLTLRENTERPVTITDGTNRLVGCRGPAIVEAALRALTEPAGPPRIPPLWDGHAAERIVDVLLAPAR
jgi:UDP-N-acetylglucosamine 2-epimerase (non-hydrolysing)